MKASWPSWAMHPISAPTGDECKDHVPLSQETMPVDNLAYVCMMGEAMVTPPAVVGKVLTLQASYMPTSATLEKSPQVTNIETGAQVHDIIDADKGTKRARAVTVTWDDESTYTLLRVYEEQWSHIKKGIFRTKDWEALTFALNRQINRSFNPEHVRSQIDMLKKLHKKELRKVNSTGSIPSTGAFFDLCGSLWGKTPKCTGIVGALDSDAQSSSSIVTEAAIDLDAVDGGSTSQDPQLDKNDAVDPDEFVGKKVKQSKRSSLGAVVRTMGDRMKEMCAAYEHAEEKKTTILRELEMITMAHEERLVRIEEEEKTKRHQIFLENAKLLSKKQK